MSKHQPFPQKRQGQSLWTTLLFMIGFGSLLIGLSVFYLVPALEASGQGTPVEKQRLAGYSTLLLTVFLVVLLIGMLLVFRLGRLFFPTQTNKPTQTNYVDAWEEAGKRIEVPDETEDEDENEANPK